MAIHHSCANEDERSHKRYAGGALMLKLGGGGGGGGGIHLGQEQAWECQGPTDFCTAW